MSKSSFRHCVFHLKVHAMRCFSCTHLRKNLKLLRSGFTLLELLIIIGILAIMTMVIAPSFNSIGRIQVSLATEDAMRLIRYARNMALQTQKPIHITFSNNCISVKAEEHKQKLTYTTADFLDEQLDTPTIEAITTPIEETKKENPNFTIETNGFDTIDITKYYQEVRFKFIEYTDLVRHKTNLHGEFERRIDPNQLPEKVDEDGSSTFTLVIRANGTMRPCTIQVYPEGSDTISARTGNTINFDFLCTGTIDE